VKSLLSRRVLGLELSGNQVAELKLPGPYELLIGAVERSAVKVREKIRDR
jgi:hypothetical protein